jgi:hypothetical protein
MMCLLSILSVSTAGPNALEYKTCPGTYLSNISVEGRPGISALVDATRNALAFSILKFDEVANIGSGAPPDC